jgi:hypothetical protein
VSAGSFQVFDRSQFAHLSLQDLVAERDALRRKLEESRSDRPGVSLDQLTGVLMRARAELEQRLGSIRERAAATGEVRLEDLAGLGDLWTLARDPALAAELESAVSARDEGAQAALAPEEHDHLRAEIGVREAELTLRVAEAQLTAAGEELDPLLAERLAEQVLLQHRTSRDSEEG